MYLRNFSIDLLQSFYYRVNHVHNACKHYKLLYMIYRDITFSYKTDIFLLNSFQFRIGSMKSFIIAI